MRILFLHQNFPGQFVHIARALRDRADVEIVAVSDKTNAKPILVPTIHYNFEPKTVGNTNSISAHFAARATRGAHVGRVLLKLRERGFTPDLVVGHFGWGETLFVKDVFPNTKLLVYAEYFYSSSNGDADFDQEFLNKHNPIISDFRIRAKNAALLSALVDADYCVAPTKWQGSRFPKEFQKKIVILHEGIDTSRLRPDPEAIFSLSDGLRLTREDEVITFVNRNLEPHRGYHIFMRALPKILAKRPNAHVVIVGGDGVSYGAEPPRGQTWKQIFLDEVAGRLPLDRVHFTGKIPHVDFLRLMQISKAHVYLTYPFVLSWSMLEAMSAAALVIGSKTAPVEEVITDGKNGLLVDFFDIEGLADRVISALAEPHRYAALREAGRQTIEQRFDLKTKCLPQWLAFIDLVTGSHPDSPLRFRSVEQPSSATTS